MPKSLAGKLKKPKSLVFIDIEPAEQKEEIGSSGKKARRELEAEAKKKKRKLDAASDY